MPDCPPLGVGRTPWFDLSTTLPEQWARTEQRGADAQVCRAVVHRRLQVPAHPGRQHGRRRVGPAQGLRRPRPAGRTRRPGRHPAAPPPSPPSRSRASAPRPRRPARAPRRGRRRRGPRRRTRSTCTRTPQPAAGRGRCPVQRRHQPDPVDGVDDVAAAGDHRRLVGLHLADEVPDQVGQAGRPAGLGLGRGVRGAVLADVAHAEGRRWPTSAAGKVLVTATRVISARSRPAAWQAAAIRASTCSRPAASSARRGRRGRPRSRAAPRRRTGR